MGFTVCLASLLVISSAAAQQPAFKPSLSGLHKAIAAENYGEARKHADGLLQAAAQPADRGKAAVAYGRVLLGLGQKDAARQYLAMMKRQPLEGDAPALMDVYEAWLTALDGKQDAAIKTLEAILAKNMQDLPTVEAADVLAMLYMAKGDKPAAKRAVDYGLQSIKYASLKTDYTETLLKNRLKSNITSPEAEKAYQAAEKLRQQGKFTEAGQAFMQLRAQYPRTEWAHAAGFRAGQCLVGLNRTPQALDHWKTFVNESPDGPWRGQARVALIDAVLETTLDLKTASEHAMAATASLAKPREKEDEASWTSAAYDIHLRQGIVSLVDGRFDAAVLALQNAQQSIPKPTGASGSDVIELVANLDRLIEAAQKRSPLVPDELTVGDPRAVVALSLGNVQNLLQRYETAQKFFGLPLTGASATRSAAHRSFAALGLARATTGLARRAEKDGVAGKTPPESLFAQAKAYYQQSLKEYANGSWHDETLYQLAAIIEEQAEGQWKTSRELADNKDRTKAAKAGNPSQQSNRNDKTEKERRAALVKAKSEALVFWQELVKRYPQSVRCEQAMHRGGILLYDMAEVTPEEAQTEQTWRESAALLKKFCTAYPRSPYCGDAYVRQIDIALERQFDPKAALTLSSEAADWAKWAIGSSTIGSPNSSSWILLTKYPDQTAIKRSVHDCLLRLGIVAYLAGDFDKANQWIDIAGPKPPAPGFTANPDMESLTLYYLQKAINSKKAVTDQRAINAAKNDEQRLLLQLGDLYLETIRPEKAEKAFLRIVERNVPLGRVPSSVEAYALLQLATSLDRQSARRHEALERLNALVARRDLQGTCWHGYGLFRLALFTYNQTQDPTKSMPLYRRMLSQYPEHEMAEVTHLYYCLDLIQLKDASLAGKASQDFLAKYPKSDFRSLLEKRITTLVTESNAKSPVLP
jgi:tetratricopeptide (TPR) repeat protein